VKSCLILAVSTTCGAGENQNKYTCKIGLNPASSVIKNLRSDYLNCWSLKRAGEFREMINRSTDKAFCVDDLIMHDTFQLALIAAIFFFYFQSAEGIVQLNK